MRDPRPYPARRDARRGENGVTTQAAHTLLSRRALLAQGGALVVTFAVTSQPIRAEAARPADKTVAADEVAGFISIDATGKVTIYSGKVELGTGATTAIAQIAAEELSVSLDRVTMIQGDTLLTPNQGPTYASLSIQDGGMQIRRAAATAREALLQRAADNLKVAKDTLTVQDGLVTSRAGGDKLSYVQLIDGKKLAMKIDPAAPLKDPKDYTIVGTSVPRRDIPAKIFGTFNFVQDHKLPAACACRSPCGRRRNTRTMERRRLPENPRLCARGSQGQLPGRRGDRRMGRDQGIDRDCRNVVHLGRPTRGIQAL